MEDKGLLSDFIKAGELHMVAGVKGSGKTTLLLNIAENMLHKNDRGQVLYYFSLPNGEIALPEDTKIALREVSALPLQTGHFYLDAHLAKEEVGLNAIIIDDYRFLLRTEYFQKEDLSRQEKVLFLLTRLKSLAEAYAVPVIISTIVDDDYIWGRTLKMPMISDIPDHEYVETLVDRLILLHREELFSEENDKKGVAELKLYELATGGSMDYKLAFLPEFPKFCEFEE